MTQSSSRWRKTVWGPQSRSEAGCLAWSTQHGMQVKAIRHAAMPHGRLQQHRALNAPVALGPCDKACLQAEAMTGSSTWQSQTEPT